MKKIITTDESGLDSLLGEVVLVMCTNYFYEGTLEGIGDAFLLLKNPSIVYETGAWDEKGYSDIQLMNRECLYISRLAIESISRSDAKK